MIQTLKFNSKFRRIALIGTYLPRLCGIATFTTDLLMSLVEENSSGECWSVAMNDVPMGYQYSSHVRFEINQWEIEEYRLAAEFLNMNRVGIVCLQHEFGIFGGDNGSFVMELLNNIQMPIVTTLHTILQSPSTEQLFIIQNIAKLSDRLVVMSQRAQQILQDIYDISSEKIVLIHHGIPDIPFVDPNYYKDKYGVEGRKVILTFGLLSPNKGIETVIDALPAVIKQHPEIIYIILGSTHPHVKNKQGESYRFSLQRRAKEQKVENYLIFHNRFVELKELCEFLDATDIYITPYLNQEQAVSGTLTYALGSGKAIISTPYWYAKEMLGNDRGRLVPFQNTTALSEQLIYLLDNEVERHAMRKRAYTFCRGMIWKEVARQYLALFNEIKLERSQKPIPIFQNKTIKSFPYEFPKLKLDHIFRLTDNVGILQHSNFIIPNRFFGYCTDDNARALVSMIMSQDMIPNSKDLINLICIYMSFLYHAFNKKYGKFRNFMGYDRCWIDEVGSEDSHARAIMGLGKTVALANSNGIRLEAQALFKKALPVLVKFKYPRAWAFALTGICFYLRWYSGDSEVKRIREILANNIFQEYRKNASDDWPWIEDLITYANGKIPQALIMAGRSLKNKEMLEVGLQSLEWLIEIQTDKIKGHFVPIGNNGWYQHGKSKARFDQQPIEVMNIIEACCEAYEINNNDKWFSQAQLCLEWFIGNNDLNLQMYDHQTGGCYDGLNAEGYNRNQGAESTLSFILSLLNFNRLRNRQISV